MKIIFDADKIVEKAKKKRLGVYQSSQHPEHFDNEGGEYQEVPGLENGIAASIGDEVKEKPKKEENTNSQKKGQEDKENPHKEMSGTPNPPQRIMPLEPLNSENNKKNSNF